MKLQDYQNDITEQLFYTYTHTYTYVRMDKSIAREVR